MFNFKEKSGSQKTDVLSEKFHKKISKYFRLIHEAIHRAKNFFFLVMNKLKLFSANLKSFNGSYSSSKRSINFNFSHIVHRFRKS